MKTIRASERKKSRIGRLVRPLENAASMEPSRSPIFQKTIAKGMNASGRNHEGAAPSGVEERILEAKTGDTAETQKHRKLALAGQ